MKCFGSTESKAKAADKIKESFYVKRSQTDQTAVWSSMKIFGSFRHLVSSERPGADSELGNWLFEYLTRWLAGQHAWHTAPQYNSMENLEAS